MEEWRHNLTLAVGEG